MGTSVIVTIALRALETASDPYRAAARRPSTTSNALLTSASADAISPRRARLSGSDRTSLMKADVSRWLDVMAPSPWRAWSEDRLGAAAEAGDLAINQVIYAEVAVGFASAERLERTLQGVGLKRLALPWAAAWRVAEAFREYRRAGGPRPTPLPDFFIGAHAAVASLTLLTRDPRRVRAYFPDASLIAPDRA